MDRSSRSTLAAVGIAAALVTLTATPPAAAAEASAAFTPEERQTALELLDRSHQEVVDLTGGISDAAWSWKPAPDRWSVGETAEHIMLTEEMLLGLVREMLAGEPVPDWAEKSAGKLAAVQAFMPDRSQKVTAPSAVTPTGTVGRDECLERFESARGALRELTATAEGDVKAHLFDHPAFGDMNTYQVLVFIAEHNLRHNRQIEEVQASPGWSDMAD